MTGLLLALTDYEWCQYDNSDRGLAYANIGDKWDGNVD